MKIFKSALFLMIISFATAFSQPQLPPDRNPESLQNELNLNDSQKEKIETILAHKRDNLDRIRNKMMAIMEKLQDSTQYISNETEKEIMKVLNKEQAEEFKIGTERQRQFAMMPPERIRSNGFYTNMPVPNQPLFNQFGRDGQRQDLIISGRFSPKPCETDCMDGRDDSSVPDFQNLCNPDTDDIDFLEDLDIFDLMDILE